MRQNLTKLGPRIKGLRKEQAMTLSDVAEKTGLTTGLLSKIENFRTIPSLPVLIKIAAALDVPAATLLEDIRESGDSAKWILVRKDDRAAIERESSHGFSYQSLLETESAGINLQAMVLTVQPGAVREKVTTEGDQFIMILHGKVDFLLEYEKIALYEGDFLFFDGNIPHVPVNNSNEPAVLLAVYLLKN